jgi:hypothetical protein
LAGTGGGGGGGGTCGLIGFFSAFSTEVAEGGGDDGRDSFFASGSVIGFVAFTAVETWMSSSTSGTANIFFDSRYFIQNDMILFTRLIFFLLHLLSILSLDLSFFNLTKRFPKASSRNGDDDE